MSCQIFIKDVESTKDYREPAQRIEDLMELYEMSQRDAEAEVCRVYECDARGEPFAWKMPEGTEYSFPRRLYQIFEEALGIKLDNPDSGAYYYEGGKQELETLLAYCSTCFTTQEAYQNVVSIYRYIIANPESRWIISG